uniref:Junctional cadherin 5-associated protein isoform X1 n=2 Tax=Pogona vitticeps TaxID=103695 RepID=A0ABM5GN49_9SAUR
MFSVEDLLISHGYKLSKNPTNLYEDRSDGFQHEVADKRSRHGTLNGFLTSSGADATSKKIATKNYLNNNENSHVIKEKHPGPSYPNILPPLASMHVSEVELYDRPQLGWSSRPKTDKDLAYWRRRGQDFSVLLGYTDKGESQMKGMAAPCALYGRDKESQWEMGGGVENIRRTGMPENSKPSGDYRWQSLRTDGWNQPTKFGGLMSDGDIKRLPQNTYSVRQGDTTATSHAKGKSQSLPRVLSPESLKCVDMPSLVTHKHSLSATKTVSCPPSGLSLETSQHSDPGFPFLPLPKPKYGRPLKPPSYELHQQTRGVLETNTLQDDLRKDGTVFSLTKVNDQMQEACIQDSSLEPPLYVPPPCYKSPAQQTINQHLPGEVPDYGMCFNNGMQSPIERTVGSHQPPEDTFKTAREHCKDKQIPHDKKCHSQHVEGHLSSVLYIPFDDPRIRHIKIAHPDGLQNNERVAGDANSSRSYAFQGCPLELEYDSAFSDTTDSLNPSVRCSQDTGSSALGSRWLAESNVDQDGCALSIQREGHDASQDLNRKCSKGKGSAHSPPAEPPYETVTKVKTFEPGSEMHSRRSSKKKRNETIFCLVSIPVKSDLNLPDTDGNNNLTQGAVEKNGFDNSGVLQEQSLLSTSSTDLELQALTGSMTNKNELHKQELWKPEFKRMNDLRFLQPAEHKEHPYSGSWPGEQYKDQQTQTSFVEEPKTLKLLHSLEPRGSNTQSTFQLPRYGTSTTEPVLTVLPASNRKCGQVASTVKDQGCLDKSSTAVCSEVGTSSPKACQNLPCASCTTLPGQEQETGSPLREEVSAPCRSKELFGQFLLKPVNRRPWDIISELESFNKELQEHEESSDDSVESDSKWDRAEEETAGRKERGTFSNDEPSHDHGPGMQSEAVMPVAPVFKQEKGKSLPGSLNASANSSSKVIPSGLHGSAGSQSYFPIKKKDEVVRTANGCLVAEPRKQEVGGRIIRQTLSPHPSKIILSDSYDDDKDHSNPFNSIDFREESHLKNYRDNLVDVEKVKKNAMPRNNIPLERGSAVRLSLTNRNQGLSEPDLRSVGLDDTQGPELDCYGNPLASAIPPNESLQARAARILGIDVPVESLVPKSKVPRGDHSRSENTLQSSELSTEKEAMEAKPASYEGRRKCGWTESSFFVGDRNTSVGSVEDSSSAQENLIAEQHFEYHQGLDRQGKDQTSPLESMGLPFAERNMVPSSSEKRARSTSKVIETLQGKLAAPPNRAAMDRLVRMKEVHSVSRMRRLSIKNTDSGEDGDEEKQSKGPEEKGAESSSGRSELPRRLSHGSSVSKRIISLAENGLSDNRNEKKTGKDVFCSDAYDPTRVERV